MLKIDKNKRFDVFSFEVKPRKVKRQLIVMVLLKENLLDYDRMAIKKFSEQRRID